MSSDRKRKGSKKAENVQEIESSEVPAVVPAAEDLFIGFNSNAIFPAHRFTEPPPLQLSLPSNINIKQESSDDDSDGSTETVIRGETNSDEIAQEFENISPNFNKSIRDQNFDMSPIHIKTEHLPGNKSSNPLKNAVEIQNGTPFVSFLRVEATKEKSIPTEDAVTHWQISEQRNESKNSLPDADRSSEILHIKVKTEPVSFSPPATAITEKQDLHKTACSTSIHVEDSFSDCQTTEQRNESSNSLPDSDRSSEIHKKVKTEPVSISPPAIAIKVKHDLHETACSIPSLVEGSFSDCRTTEQRKESNYSSPDANRSSEIIHKKVKTEPFSFSPPVSAITEKQVHETVCPTPMLVEDSFRDCQTTEQRNESSNSLPNSDRIIDIIHKKIKTESVSLNLPAMETNDNRSAVSPRPSTESPNSFNHSRGSKEQSHSTPDSDIHIEKVIKKEPVSPERMELSEHKNGTSPNNVMNSNKCSSVDSKLPSPLKSIADLKSPLFDPNLEFSTDCVQFLSNVDFTLEDITEIINDLSAKFLSGVNLGENSASLNSSKNITCVSIENVKKEKCVSPKSLSNNKLSENPEYVTCINASSASETGSKDISKDLNGVRMETPCTNNKQFKLEKNQIQSKSLNLAENATLVEETNKYLSGTTTRHDKNVLNFEQIQEKLQSAKPAEDSFNKFIDKGSSLASVSAYSNERLNEILNTASSASFLSLTRSHEYPTVTEDCHPVSSKSSSSQIGAIAPKRKHAYEDFANEFSNLQMNNSFIEIKKPKSTPLPENIYRNEGLPETAPSKTVETAGLEKFNRRKWNDSKEASVKRIKMSEYQNNCNKLMTQTSTFMEPNVKVIREVSPLASRYSSSVLSPETVHPSTSSDGFKRNVDLSEKFAGNIYTQCDTIPKDPRLHRNVLSVSPPDLQSVTTGVVSLVQSSSKEANVQKHRSPSHATAITNKSYHLEDASRNQKCRRLDSIPPSYSHSHMSTSSSSKLHNSHSITDAREVVTKAGKKTYTAQDIPFYIIGWDTKWLHQMKEELTCQICKDLNKVVQDSYESFSEYYSTYWELHLLSIWHDIYESWDKRPLSFPAQLIEEEPRNFYYRNLCSATVPATEMPITQGIVCITCRTLNGDQQCLFGFVYDVKQRTSPNKSPPWKDIKFSFYTKEKLPTQDKSLHFQKLSRLRVAIKQLSSLEFFDSSPMKNVLLNPKKHSREIAIFNIPANAITEDELQPHLSPIIATATSPDNLFTLVVQLSDVAVFSLVRNFLKRGSTILLCLRDTERCFQFARILDHGFVLALKESEILDIPEKFKELTLRSNAAKFNSLSLEAAELVVLKNAKIILTVTSRIFLGDNKNAISRQKLTVIIEDSTMCTELETALPLSYGPENVVLLGDPDFSLDLNRHLNLREYHRTLFHRLFEGKNRM